LSNCSERDARFFRFRNIPTHEFKFSSTVLQYRDLVVTCIVGSPVWLPIMKIMMTVAVRAIATLFFRKRFILTDIIYNYYKNER